MIKQEDMTYEMLEAIASDASVSVPEDLQDGLRAGLDTLEFLSEEKGGKVRRLNFATGIAASAVLIAGLGLGIAGHERMPEDTFTDPDMAYAQLQEAFSMISTKMNKGLDMAKEAGNVLVITNEIMDKIN